MFKKWQILQITKFVKQTVNFEETNINLKVSLKLFLLMLFFFLMLMRVLDSLARNLVVGVKSCFVCYHWRWNLFGATHCPVMVIVHNLLPQILNPRNWKRKVHDSATGRVYGGRTWRTIVPSTAPVEEDAVENTKKVEGLRTTPMN